MISFGRLDVGSLAESIRRYSCALSHVLVHTQGAPDDVDLFMIFYKLLVHSN